LGGCKCGKIGLLIHPVEMPSTHRIRKHLLLRHQRDKLAPDGARVAVVKVDLSYGLIAVSDALVRGRSLPQNTT
jgi:hypothetical protein